MILDVRTMNIEAREKLAALIKRSRGDMSQRDFAKLVGVSYGAIQLWEKAEVSPDTKNLELIATGTGFSLQELLEYLELPGEAPSDVDLMIERIRAMPREYVAKIAQAAVERLAAA